MITDGCKSEHQQEFKIKSWCFVSIISNIHQQWSYNKNMNEIYPIGFIVDDAVIHLVYMIQYNQ